MKNHSTASLLRGIPLRSIPRRRETASRLGSTESEHFHDSSKQDLTSTLTT